MPLGKPNGPTVGFNMPMGKVEKGPLSALAHQIDERWALNKKRNKAYQKQLDNAQAEKDARRKARDDWDQKIQEHLGQADPDMDWGTIQEVQERQRQKNSTKTSLGSEIAVRPSDEKPRPELRDPKTGKMQANPAYAVHKKREAEWNRIQTQQANIQTVGIHKTPMNKVEDLRTSKTSKYYPKPGEGVSEDASKSAVNAFSSNLSAAQARSAGAPHVPEGATPFEAWKHPQQTASDGSEDPMVTAARNQLKTHRAEQAAHPGGTGYEIRPLNAKGNLE